MWSATETALATPELLEAILLGVDMRTVLISAQRVCRYWRELISQSGPLQEHLYFKPRRTTYWDDLEENQLACVALPLVFAEYVIRLYTPRA
ncbi:hypothetical protein PG999_006749 [Apiospora kogelbergensis]|uniref:F-box domain-containing protein n=1 Tax=Apiospora kogelbergensis TaxID=1337665 RepID=A0AAW0QWC8_9PEZI